MIEEIGYENHNDRDFVHSFFHLYLCFKSFTNLFSGSILLFMAIFLTYGGQIKARPMDVSEIYKSDGNRSVVQQGMQAQPKHAVEEIHVLEPRSSDNFDKAKRLEVQEYPKAHAQEDLVLTEGVVNVSDQDPTVRDTRTARNAGNDCIERYTYRTIYNYLFKIPVCKTGCRHKFKTVNFSGGITMAIAYDCEKIW